MSSRVTSNDVPLQPVYTYSLIVEHIAKPHSSDLGFNIPQQGFWQPFNGPCRQISFVPLTILNIQSVCERRRRTLLEVPRAKPCKESLHL